MRPPARTRPVRDLVARRVNPAVAHEVAAAYLDPPGDATRSVPLRTPGW